MPAAFSALSDADDALLSSATSIQVYRSRLRLKRAANAAVLRSERERFDAHLLALRAKAAE